MTTTTRTTLEADKVVGEPDADPAVEQQGKAMDEAAPAAVPWSELAPSDYAVLTLMFAFGAPYEEREVVAMVATGSPAYPADVSVGVPTFDAKDLAGAGLAAAVMALVETGVAHLAIEEKEYVFGLFMRRTAWVSKGDSEESWPKGSTESQLQAALAGTPVKLRDLVAGWIGGERRDPWKDMRGRIVDRLVSQGTVERREEKHSFLFFTWKSTTHEAAERTENALADYARAARTTGLGLPFLDRSPEALARREVISGEIEKGFAERTEQPDGD